MNFRVQRYVIFKKNPEPHPKYLCMREKMLNFEVEKQKKEIDKQKKTNESLAMTIDELASLTKIQEVAEQQGLSYNNNNIKTVEEDN